MPTENWARYDTLQLMTKHGPLNIVVPDRTESGHSALSKNSTRETFEGETARVITIATWVSLKEATGRAKDLEHLDRYYRHVPAGTDLERKTGLEPATLTLAT